MNIAPMRLAALSITLVSLSAFGAPPNYKIVDITPAQLNGIPVIEAQAYGIARNGMICGRARLQGNKRVGFRYFNGNYTMIDHSFPLTGTLDVKGVNSKGEVVGTYEANDGRLTAFHSVGDQFVPLTTTYKDTEARAINDDGTIVGSGYDTYDFTNQDEAALIWKNGTQNVLERMVNHGNVGIAISHSGVIGGIATSPDSYAYRGCVWVDGKLTFVTPPYDGVSGAKISGVADNGQIVGQFARANRRSSGFQVVGGLIHELERKDWMNSTARYVNEHGIVLGGAWNQDIQGNLTNSEAVLWDKQQCYSLESLVTDRPAADYFEWLTVLSQNSNTIVGASLRQTGLSRAVVYQPVPESATWFALGVGSLVLVRRKR